MKCRLRKQFSRFSFFKPTILTWKSCWTVVASQREAQERESETERGAVRPSTGEGDAHSGSEIRLGERERCAQQQQSSVWGERCVQQQRDQARRERGVQQQQGSVWGERCAQQQRDLMRRERDARSSSRVAFGERDARSSSRGKMREREARRDMRSSSLGESAATESLARERHAQFVNGRERSEIRRRRRASL